MTAGGGSASAADASPLDPALLLSAYAQGVFPMADGADDPVLHWIEPRHRAILPLDGFRPSRSLLRSLRRDPWTVTADTAFDAIVGLCAEAAPDRPDTWINARLRASYALLQRHGHAHSVEVWHGGVLAGGLYGVTLGRAFFGESMVSRITDASKVALCALVPRLRAGGFALLDCQFMTPHLATLGAVELPQRIYLRWLGAALAGAPGPSVDDYAVGPPSRWGSPRPPFAPADWSAFDRLAAPAASSGAAGPMPGQLISQALTNTS